MLKIVENMREIAPRRVCINNNKLSIDKQGWNPLLGRSEWVVTPKIYLPSYFHRFILFLIFVNRKYNNIRIELQLQDQVNLFDKFQFKL